MEGAKEHILEKWWQHVPKIASTEPDDRMLYASEILYGEEPTQASEVENSYQELREEN